MNEFVDAVFLFNVSYSGAAESFLSRFAHFFAPQRHPFIFDSALPLWLGGIVAGVLLTIEVAAHRRKEAAALLLLVLSTYITVCLPAHFWPHYYYLLIPVLCVAVPAAVARSPHWVGSPSRGLQAARSSAQAEACGSDHTVPSERSKVSPVTRPIGWHSAGLALFVVFPVALLATEYHDYWSQPPFGITVKRYNSRDFWGRAQGENVRRVTDPNDAVFVFGNDPEIYYYSGRRCASRFTMITGLQSGFSGAEGRREILMKELRERPPRLIVVLFEEKPFAEWAAFLREYYGEPVGWDFHDRSGEPIMFVLSRNDQPVESINWNWDRSQVGGWMLGEKP